MTMVREDGFLISNGSLCDRCGKPGFKKIGPKGCEILLCQACHFAWSKHLDKAENSMKANESWVGFLEVYMLFCKGGKE